MSYLIKGGYDIFRKQITNISLKRTDRWVQGTVLGRQNKFICTLNPQNDNIFEIVKYNNMHVLLMNNAIVYENEKLFYYNIDLRANTDLVNISDNNMYSFIDYNRVNYENIKNIQAQRHLN
jgi:hypothetical protein